MVPFPLFLTPPRPPLHSFLTQSEDDLEVEYDQEAELEDLIEFDRMQVDEILEMVRRDVSVIKKLEAQAPQAVKDFLEGTDFWETVKARYEELDTDGSGAIEAPELFPVIVELTASESWAVSLEHCQRFLRFFDTDGDGVISIDEFFDLLRFCVIITNVDGNSGEEGALEAEGEQKVADAKDHVDQIIKCVAEDAKLIDRFEEQCPESVKVFLRSAEFWGEVQQRYTELDVDKNGVVEPEELFPIIIELTNSEPWAITDKHCRKFAQIFDSNGDGKVNMKEFENLVRFTVIMSAMDEQVEMAEAEA
jgi:Ca2+-binding EF-hand superfamily protein